MKESNDLAERYQKASQENDALLAEKDIIEGYRSSLSRNEDAKQIESLSRLYNLSKKAKEENEAYILSLTKELENHQPILLETTSKKKEIDQEEEKAKAKEISGFSRKRKPSRRRSRNAKRTSPTKKASFLASKAVSRKPRASSRVSPRITPPSKTRSPSRGKKNP